MEREKNLKLETEQLHQSGQSSEAEREKLASQLKQLQTERHGEQQKYGVLEKRLGASESQQESLSTDGALRVHWLALHTSPVLPIYLFPVFHVAFRLAFIWVMEAG